MPAEQFSGERAGWCSVPIRNLGLTITGTPLEPILDAFRAELAAVGIRRLRPDFYLSTEWGVPFGTISIAIPFYLAHPELVQLQAERAGHVEGTDQADIIRYLRHEMGHVVNYAYRLYDQDEWAKLFGSIDQDYEEEYYPRPWDRRFVVHLPGWYAQKHPDEDWAETFAVWMTPGLEWRAEYADWPGALAKLTYCDRTMAELRDRDPLVTETELDEDVGALTTTLDQYYESLSAGEANLGRGLDSALRVVFEKGGRPASELVRRVEQELLACVYRWTGHFPERTRVLLHQVAKRADALGLGYAEQRETQTAVALATLVTSLAMNHIHSRHYFT